MRQDFQPSTDRLATIDGNEYHLHSIGIKGFYLNSTIKLNNKSVVKIIPNLGKHSAGCPSINRVRN